MTERSKRRIKRTAEAGARTVGDVIKLILKIIGTVLLIGITSGVIFACIFAMYVKTHIAQDLTLELEAFTLSESSVVYYYDEEVDDYVEWVTLHSSEYRILVDYEDIPLDMEHAVVAIEDKRFYTHDGVDWYRTAGALSNMFFRSRDTFGGSTITQQLIKNITGKDEVTVERKLREIFQALDMEKNYEKDEILTSYLNTVYFGHGCYGVGAAAKYYFGKEVSDLTLAESACIVGITNNPSLYSPFADLEANKERQEDILWSMWDQGYIDEATYRDAIAEELVFDYSESDEEDTDIYPWFVEALLDDVIDDLAELKNCTTTVAETLLLSGGYKIYATVDMDIQNQIDLIYEDLEQIPYVGGSSEQIQSAIVIIDQYTGNIVGLSGGV